MVTPQQIYQPETALPFLTAMSGAVTPVAVVTTDGPARLFGVTVSSFASVSAYPPMVLVCINSRSPAVTAIDQNGCFCVNLLETPNRGSPIVFPARQTRHWPMNLLALTGILERLVRHFLRRQMRISTVSLKINMRPVPTIYSLASCVPYSPLSPPRWPIPSAAIKPSVP